MTLQEARQTMWAAFEQDPGVQEVYIANIACVLMDAQEGYGMKLDLSDYQVRMAVARRVFEHMYKESNVEKNRKLTSQGGVME